MKYKIILVPFPFDDFSDTKVRPAVCLTNKIGQYNHIIISFITSQISKANKDTDIIINDLQNTGLKTLSAIKLHKLVTISTSIIKRELGVLPVSYQEKVNTKLKEIFDIN